LTSLNYRILGSLASVQAQSEYSRETAAESSGLARYALKSLLVECRPFIG